MINTTILYSLIFIILIYAETVAKPANVFLKRIKVIILITIKQGKSTACYSL